VSALIDLSIPFPPIRAVPVYHDPPDGRYRPPAREAGPDAPTPPDYIAGSRAARHSA